MLEITLYNSQMKWAIKKLLIKRHAANQQAKQQNRNDNNRHAETNANGSKAQQKQIEVAKTQHQQPSQMAPLICDASIDIY